MRALLINPFDESISETSYDGDYKSISKILEIDSRPFTVLRFGDQDQHHVYLDDEGLLQPSQRFFCLAFYSGILAGKALILRSDMEGNDLPATMTLLRLSPLVKFLPSTVRCTGMKTEEGVVEHPVFGKVNTIRSRPIFVDTSGMN